MNNLHYKGENLKDYSGLKFGRSISLQMSMKSSIKMFVLKNVYKVCLNPNVVPVQPAVAVLAL